MIKMAGKILTLIAITAVIAIAQNVGTSTLIKENRSFKIETGSSFSASGSRPGRARASVVSKREALVDAFAEAMKLIEENHLYGTAIRPENLTETSVQGMLRTLDPHSRYYRPSEFSDLMNDYEGEYSGIGVSIADYSRAGNTETYVLAAANGSPAAINGLRFGDKIIAVNGRTLSGEGSAYARDLIRGTNGTQVELTIERAASGETKMIRFERRQMEQPTVPDAFIIGSNAGYIDLTRGFGFSTDAEFDAALLKLKALGATALVLDLRGNPGGILDRAVKIAGRFLPNGSTIVSQRGRTPNDSSIWKANNTRAEELPLVALVDGQTASASEVLAGALQDNDRALIIGEPTFGKGLVQNILELPDGGGLTLTAAEYFTPSGRSIQRDYSNGSIYDYYNHKNRIAEIDRPMYAAKTVTNRTVYGGDGISPDIAAEREKFTELRLSLLDPTFFFVRDKDGTANFRKFADYAEQTWHIPGNTLENEQDFIIERLKYLSDLQTEGTRTALRRAVASDPQVKIAVENIPASAKLAAAARIAIAQRTTK